VFAFLSTEENSYTTETEAFCFMILLAFVNLLQYLRIFREFRYQSVLIVEVVKETVTFLFIQLILMFGFSLAFYWRKNYNNEGAELTGSPWTKNFLSVYYVAFADFGETSDYTSDYDWVFFFLANFIICIIMMNLLIGILSEKLGEIMGRKD
jgi:hypothetical protein